MAHFDDGMMSSGAGVLLLRAVEWRLRPISRLARWFEDRRGPFSSTPTA